jgi:hypothetical protein
MVIDVFTYFNETDIIDLRMKVLEGLVDMHIAIQASQTFTGEPREQAELPEGPHFRSWCIDFPREDMTPWEREIYQRNYIGTLPPFSDGHYLISDADEIPNPETVQWCLDTGVHEARLDVDQYFWNLNWQAPKPHEQGRTPHPGATGAPWYHPRTRHTWTDRSQLHHSRQWRMALLISGYRGQDP